MLPVVLGFIRLLLHMFFQMPSVRERGVSKFGIIKLISEISTIREETHEDAEQVFISVVCGRAVGFRSCNQLVHSCCGGRLKVV